MRSSPNWLGGGYPHIQKFRIEYKDGDTWKIDYKVMFARRRNSEMRRSGKE